MERWARWPRDRRTIAETVGTGERCGGSETAGGRRSRKIEPTKVGDESVVG